MKNIKKFNEIFDDEELKAEFEIPYLKGEMGKKALSWQKVAEPLKDETPDSFHRKILFRFPILNYFNEEVAVLPQGQNVHCNYVSSTVPASDGNKYYAQIVSSYNEDRYYLDIILRDVMDYDNPERWDRHEFQFKDIDGVYEVAEEFINICSKLGIISPEQRNALEAN